MEEDSKPNSKGSDVKEEAELSSSTDSCQRIPRRVTIPALRSSSFDVETISSNKPACDTRSANGLEDTAVDGHREENKEAKVADAPSAGRQNQNGLLLRRQKNAASQRRLDDIQSSRTIIPEDKKPSTISPPPRAVSTYTTATEAAAAAAASYMAHLAAAAAGYPLPGMMFPLFAPASGTAAVSGYDGCAPLIIVGGRHMNDGHGSPTVESAHTRPSLTQDAVTSRGDMQDIVCDEGSNNAQAKDSGTPLLNRGHVGANGRRSRQWGWPATIPSAPSSPHQQQRHRTIANKHAVVEKDPPWTSVSYNDDSCEDVKPIALDSTLDAGKSLPCLY
jgi:hypothetical protein